MRAPTGLETAGKRLWKATDEVFDLTDEPHKVQLLSQACRVADVIAELDVAAAEAPLLMKGSVGQPVISPLLAEARMQRALLGTLLGRLGLPDTEEQTLDKKRHVTAVRHEAARSGWSPTVLDGGRE